MESKFKQGKKREIKFSELPEAIKEDVVGKFRFQYGLVMSSDKEPEEIMELLERHPLNAEDGVFGIQAPEVMLNWGDYYNDSYRASIFYGDSQ